MRNDFDKAISGLDTVNMNTDRSTQTTKTETKREKKILIEEWSLKCGNKLNLL